MTIYVRVIILLSVFFIQSCIDGPSSKFKITDNYYIYSDDGKNNFLLCKLGCESDPEIENVTRVDWNEKVMLLETKENSLQNFYLVIANGDVLSCCNQDAVIGPFVKIQLDSIKIKYNFNSQFKNSKAFD